MRLIEVDTQRLASFSLDEAPQYAILSHTWSENDEDELTVRDILEGDAKLKAFGYTKLDGCCREAKKDGLGYVWIDTCCIDKTNQVELSEAINSMFKWYQHAAVCYVYLTDVLSEDQLPGSRWFTRGWTLQELIAPSKVNFYKSDWHFLGTRAELSYDLEAITSIPEEFLHGDGDFLKASVAQRMSWASNRSTKREEDMAYCLLGIFDVSVPILYGDSHAFAKVQQAIMAKNRDDSIFAWGPESMQQASESPPPNPISAGAFATEPADFMKCGKIISRGFQHTPSNKFSIESAYVYISLVTIRLEDGSEFGLLTCGPEDDPNKVVGIPLVADPSGSFFFRPQGPSPRLFSKPSGTQNMPMRPIYLQLLRDQPFSANIDRRNWFRIRTAGTGLKIVEAFPPERIENSMVKTSKDTGDGVTERTWIRLVQQKNRDPALDFILVLDFAVKRDPDSEYCHSAHCHLMVSDPHTSLRDLARSRFARLKSSFGKCQASIGNVHISASIGTAHSDVRNGQPTFLVSLIPSPTAPDRHMVNANWGIQRAQILFDLILAMKLELSLSQEKQDLEKLWAACCGRIASLEDVRMSTVAKVEKDQLPLLQEKDLLATRIKEANSRLETTISKRKTNQTALDDGGTDSGSWFSFTLDVLHDGILAELFTDPDTTVDNQQLLSMILKFRFIEKPEEVGSFTPLGWAIAVRNRGIVRRLLDEGVDLEETPSPLALAACFDDDIMSDLLHAKADVGKALNEAIENGDEPGALKLLTHRQASANLDSKAREDLLVMAAKAGRNSIIEWLLGPENQIRVGSAMNALRAAARNGHEHSAKLILTMDDGPLLGDTNTMLRQAIKDGSDLLFNIIVAQRLGQVDCNCKDTHGRSFLWHAASKGNIHAVTMLLKSRYLSTIPDNYGQTPLSCAAEKGHLEIVQKLLRFGSLADKPDDYGLTPLYYAATNGHEKVTRSLLATFGGGMTPGPRLKDAACPILDVVWGAIDRGHNQIAKLILSQPGLDIDPCFIPTGQKRCLLLRAIEQGDVELVKVLRDLANIKRPASFKFISGLGKKIDQFQVQVSTCLQYAIKRDQLEVIRMLLSLDAFTANALNDPKFGFLHLAVELGKPETVQLLLDFEGVDVNQKRSSGETPLWCAIERGGSDGVVQLLNTKKIDLNAAKFAGKTPLQFAIQIRDVGIIRELRGYCPK